MFDSLCHFAIFGFVTSYWRIRYASIFRSFLYRLRIACAYLGVLIMNQLDKAVAQIPVLIELAKRQLELESNPAKINNLQWWIEYLETQQQETKSC